MFVDVARLIVAVVLLEVLPHEPVIDIGGAVILLPLVFGLVAYLCGRWATRRVLYRPGQAVARFERRRLLLLRVCRSLDIVLYALLIGVFGWAQAVEQSRLNFAVARELLWLAPFMLASFGAAAGSFRLATFFWQPKPSMLQYAGLRMRFLALTAALYIFLFVARGMMEAHALRALLDCFPSLEILLAGALIVVAYLLFPVGLRYVFPSRPLPEGPLQSELWSMANSLRVRLSGIQLWDTQGARLSTAFVTGATGWSRWVFISDGLLTTLGAEQIVAVFAHELGHVLRNHAFYYLLFFVSLLLLVLPLDAGLDLLGVDKDSLEVAIVVVLAIFALWVLSFGYLSRRFELEADLIGATLVDDAKLYSKTLMAVGMVSGVSSERNAWRHFSIDRRRDFTTRAGNDPAFRRRWERTFRRLRSLIVAMALLSCLGFGFLFGQETSQPDAAIWLHAGQRVMARGEPQTATDYFKRSIDTGPSFAAFFGLGHAEELQDHPAEALEAYGGALELSTSAAESLWVQQRIERLRP